MGFFSLIRHIHKMLHDIKENQETIMANQSDIDTAIADFKTDVAAQFQTASDKLDAILAKIGTGVDSATVVAEIGDLKTTFDTAATAFQAKEDGNPPA